nr:acyl-ACP thioesterase domain-containing protein [uncultured Cellulosilyticum sp.]
MKVQLKETYEVEIDDIDFSSHMSLIGMAKYMQNIAAHHATELGFDYYKNGTEPKYYWVLSRVKYVLHKSIKWQDKFSLTTYPGGCDKLFAVRLFDIRDENNQPIGHIIGDYILIDTAKKRPTRITAKEPVFEVLNFKYEGEQLDKLALPENIIARERRKARYSEIDVNGHMNNTQYIKWILDMLPLETHKEKAVETLQINYNTSVMYQDEVEVVIGNAEDEGYLVAGMSIDGKTNYFTAYMTLKAREE